MKDISFKSCGDENNVGKNKVNCAAKHGINVILRYVTLVSKLVDVIMGLLFAKERVQGEYHMLFHRYTNFSIV